MSNEEYRKVPLEFRKEGEPLWACNQERPQRGNKFCSVRLIPVTGNCMQNFRDGNAWRAGLGPG